MERSFIFIYVCICYCSSNCKIPFYKYILEVIGNSLYAGVLMGFIMAVIFTTVVYLFVSKDINSHGKILNSEAFMERYFMDSWSGYFLNCS